MLNGQNIKYFLKSISNFHFQGEKGNIFLFATPRGGSTWLMEIISSQPGMKYYDEPFNIRRDNVQQSHRFSDWSDLMPGTADNKVIFDHLHDLENNKLRYMNPPPFRKNHRLITKRIVFKIHELEHLINEMKGEFDGYILYLIRHPIANTISRRVFPRLEYFVNSVYYQKYLTAEQLQKIKNIVETGTELQKGAVSWCYENLIPLMHNDRSDWCMVSYEELLLNPEKTCKLMLEKLELTGVEEMVKSVGVPAANIMMSNKDTLDIMNSGDASDKNIKMVTKWKNRVSEQEEEQVFEVLRLFKMDVYEKDRFIPTINYLNFPDTEQKI